jgi:putative flippase GtrA
MNAAEVLRFLANGLLATAVHYAILWAGFGLGVFASAGATSAAASVVASTVAFFGNRHFVFASRAPVAGQVLPFVAVYAAIALFHGAFLGIWTDLLGLAYTPGFLVALAIATVASYLMNKHLVFRPRRSTNVVTPPASRPRARRHRRDRSP